ncbi:MAG: efflux RND transporter permease subunit [Spirochaetaceae bacterium]|jgi:HAE1 family hydrophobic/amphiphilic exporter-1|nr:efflux RND transporter permease subunit [Spirochaetaceae bacterium]
MSLAKGIVGRPVLGIVVFGLVAVVALYLAPGVAIDMFPETTMPVLMVQTSYSGASPETVEKAVTRPVESALVNIGGLNSLSSTSSEGSSRVSLEFGYGADLDAKTNDIRDKLERVRRQLPDEADSPSIMQFDMNAMPIMQIAVRGGRAQSELRSIAADMVQGRLEQVDGVAQADVMGGRDRAVRVSLSQNRLEAYGLTITGISSTLALQNLELGAGSITDGTKNYSIRTTGEFASLKDIERVVVARRNGADILLADVGTVALTYPEETSTVYINGELGVYLAVTKASGTNSVTVADGVYAKLDEVRRLLPADITLEVTQDNTTQIRGMIDELINSAASGAALAMVILFVFLRNIKSTVIIGVSIPFSILVTLLVMSATGVTLNMLTMTGLILGVGMIVDSSIVILENIYKFREKGETPAAAAIYGSEEVMSSIISSTLTTLSVFVPIVLFKNQLEMMGQFFQDMIWAVGISLTSSLAVALFLVPILASRYLPLQTRTQKPLKNRLLRAVDGFFERVIQAAHNGYRRLLSGTLRHRAALIIVVVAAFAGSGLAFIRMGYSMVPPMNEDSVSITVTLPLGSRYEDTKEVMLALQSYAIDEIVGLESIITNIGSGGGGGGGAAVYRGSLTLSLDLDNPGADRSAAVQQKMRSHFAEFPNASITFGAGRGRQLAGGSDLDIALRIDDIGIGLAAAQEIAALVKDNVPELDEPSVSLTEGLPQVEVVIDRQRAYDLGLSVSGIAREVAAAMNGVTATTFRDGGNEYSVILELRKEDRQKIPDLERIFVQSSSAGLVPLSNFASLERGLGPVSISRENQSRVIHVTANLRNAGGRADLAEEKVKAALAENFVVPEGILVTYEGQWGEIQKTNRTFVAVITLAVLLVAGVMAGQYESFKDPLINLCTIPLLLIGVVFIHLVTGQNVSTFTLAGVVMLVGIVVNNGIVLVDYTNLLVRRGAPVMEAALEAAVSRFRPVLMTTLTTILGLVPMAFFPGESAMMIQPIGLAVIGGLTSSTVITLFFIPVMYSLIGRTR